jgi:hypothetical protein
MPDRDYTPYQRRAIRNFYKNQDAIGAQRLAEIVTEIYLATTEKKRASLWSRAQEILLRAGVPPAEVEKVVAARDGEALARLAQRQG